MLKKFSTPKKEDICPNCGTACFATDVLCPHCGENLDDLFEQLPESKESYDMLKIVSKHLPFSTWLIPLLIILLPLFVSFITVLPFILRVHSTLEQSPLRLIEQVVSSSTLASTIAIAIRVIPLFLCTKSFVRAKLSYQQVAILAGLFSTLTVIALWSEPQSVNYLSAFHSFVYFGLDVFLGRPPTWVYFVSVGGTALVVMMLIAVLTQEKTA